MIEYIVKPVGRPRETKIFSGDVEVGKILRGTDSAYMLIDLENNQWVLDPKVQGEIRPFSLSVRKVERPGAEKGNNDDGDDRVVLTIRYHLFQHKGGFYMFTSVPEGRHPNEFHVGNRFICRFDNFPFADVFDVDSGTFVRLRRSYRGAVVGELGGTGAEGHRVRLSEELADIALPLSASSYILYSTG